MATRIWLKDTILIQGGPYQQKSIYYWQRLWRISPFWQNQSIISTLNWIYSYPYVRW